MFDALNLWLPAPSPCADNVPGQQTGRGEQSVPGRQNGLRQPSHETTCAAGYETRGSMPTGLAPTGPADTIAARPPMEDASAAGDGPGPATHNTKGALQAGHAYAFRARQSAEGDIAAGDGPGPADYRTGGAIQSGPAYSLGAKLPMENTATDYGPGPADYDTRGVLQTGPAYTFGAKLPREDGDPSRDRPGPDRYRTGGAIPSGPAYTLGARAPTREPPDGGPGPAEYHSYDSLPSGPAYTFSGSRPPHAFPVTDAGPGAYNAPTWTQTGPAYAIGSRPPPEQQVADGRAPGPGSYTLADTWQDGPAYTIGEKGRSMGAGAGAVGDGDVGPGSYGPREAWREGPAFTMAPKLAVRERVAEEVGPGSYHVQGVWQEGPAYTFGHKPLATRPTLEDTGPGAYSDIPCFPSGPAFTMRPRHVEILTPGTGQDVGPGSYTVDASTQRGPAFTFGRKLTTPPMGMAGVEAGPGPGAYHPTSPVQGRAAGTPPATNQGAPWLGSLRATLRGLTKSGWAGVRALAPDGAQGVPTTSTTRQDAWPQGSTSGGGGSAGRYSLLESWRSGGLAPTGLLKRFQESPGPSLGATIQLAGGPSSWAEFASFLEARRSLPARPKSAPASPSAAKKDAGPGPGSYDPQVFELHPTGPAFSFGSRLAGTPAFLQGNDGPGPGAYSLEGTLPSGKAFSLAGKRAADWLIAGDPRMQVPGPGHYHASADGEAQPRDIHGPILGPPRGRSRSLSSLDRWIKDADRRAWSTPGPGFYSVDDSAIRTSAPAYSIAGVRRTDGRDKALDANAPGPGQYAPAREQYEQRGAAYSFGVRPTASVFDIKDSDLLPGPTDYCHELPSTMQLIRSRAPAYSMGKKPEPRPDPKAADKPGPGVYDVVLKPAGPAFSLGPRGKGIHDLVAEKARDLPGPGEYHLSLQPSGPTFTMAPRIPEPKGFDTRDDPGPGHYSAFSPRMHGPAYTIGARQETQEASPLPGPGAYGDSRLEYKPQGPAFSIQGKAPERAVAEEDARRGPTLYETAPAYPSGPSYSMGTRPPAPRAQELPGPGDYGPMVEEMLPQGPAFTFGIRTDPEERKREAKRHLGPGTYEPGTQHLAQGPAYTIGVPLPAPAESPTPGPGQYFGSRGLDDPSAPRGPAFSIGQRVPVPGADERANIPGPGEYYVPSQPSGPAYSIAIRPTPAKVEAGPAPGTYDTPGLPDGLAFTMGTRRPAPDAKKDHPGPGDYAIPPLNDGPAFSMGVRPTPSGPSVPEPGPGDYWVPHLLGDGGPAFSMGVRVGAPSPGPVPGPGMYDNLPPSDAPSFTIGGRIPRKDPSRDVPGPAHYNVATLETGPAFSIGTRLGPPTGIHDLDLPGPGAYDVLVPPEGPAFTIATRTAAPEPGEDLVKLLPRLFMHSIP